MKKVLSVRLCLRSVSSRWERLSVSGNLSIFRASSVWKDAFFPGTALRKIFE